MKHLLSILLLLAWVQGAALGQNPLDSLFFVEKEDSMSTLSIKPVKRPKKLLKQVIAQFQEDRMQYKEGTYQIDAIFLRDSLAPLSVRCTIPAKAGITFDESYPGFYESTSDFTCEEPYKLFRNDSIYLGKYLRAFARLNPIWAP